ncbi:MAG: VCBS repeat-containing protein, partial [Synergistaceae bacterium]|nr:VCBS repeat-containing protein [Synergistaceae bacterium]
MTDMRKNSLRQPRVAAGDFFGDGYANGLAVAYPGRGDDHEHYLIRVYKVTESGGSLSAEKKFEKDSISISADYHNGCRLLAGDFDGDGKTEIALVGVDEYDRDSENYNSVEILKWDGSSSFSHGHATDKDGNYFTGYARGYGFHGIEAEAADLDGDGKDEIVILAVKRDDTTGRAFLSVWGCDWNATAPSAKYHKFLDNLPLTGDAAFYVDDDGPGLHNDLQFGASINRAFSMAAGPFTGKVRPNGHTCDDIALSYAPLNSSNQYVYVLRTNLDDSSSFKEFSDPVQVWSGTGTSSIGLAGADFVDETVNLGDPQHLLAEANRDYAALLQVPPYHVDYIQAPWSTSADMLVTYIGSSVAYSKSSTEQDTKDYVYETRNFTEHGRTMNFSLSNNTNFPVGDGPQVATLQQLADVLTGKPPVSFGMSGGIGHSVVDSTAEVSSTANSSASSMSMTMSSSTGTADSILSYETDMYLWRYPIEGQVPAWLKDQLFTVDIFQGKGTDYVVDKVTSDDTVYVTFSMCDDPSQYQSDGTFGGQDYHYIAPHEEGNLFSYPTAINMIPDFHKAQMVLADKVTKDLSDSGFTQTLAFSQRKTNTQTDSTTTKKATTTTFSGGANLSIMKEFFNIGGDISVNTTKIKETSETETSTKTYSDSEALVVTMPSNSTLKISTQYVKYATEMQPFVDESGLIRMAFAVQFDRENAWLWRPARQDETSQSPYSVKFDPSLVLPGKFVRQVVNINGTVVIATWLPNTDQKAAMLMRGVRFYDDAAAKYTTAPLKRGGIYRISFPMYNASFYPADGLKKTVTVRLGLRLITSNAD